MEKQKNQIKVFSKENLGQVRVIGDGDNPLFCASDVCKSLGYTNGRVTIDRMFGDDVTKCYITDSIGREQLFTFLTEPQIYKLIMRSNAKNAEAFQDWVCGEVLPSIRKNGSYTIQQQFKIPQTYAEALMEAGRLAFENEKLIAKAKEDAPKVKCFNELMDCKNAIDFLEFSKILGIGRNKLFEKCRELQILMSNNRPYQRFIDNGHFRVIESTYTQGDCTKSYSKTLILPKGQAYLTKKIKVNSKD